MEDCLPELRERIRSLKRAVTERVAQAHVIQRELDSYEEIDRNRRSITEHLLLDMRVSSTPTADAPTDSEEVRQLRIDNERLRTQLADESAHGATRAAIAEMRVGIQSERQRAEELTHKMATATAAASEALASTEQKQQELEAGIAAERVRAEDRRKAWKISVDADKMRAARVEQELANVRDELERAAHDERTRIKSLETSLTRTQQELEATRTHLASEHALLDGAHRLTKILRAKLSQMQEMMNLHAGEDGDATGAGAAALADLDPATELDSLLDDKISDKGPTENR